MACYEPQVLKLHPTIKAFLEGVYDEECVLFLLNGLHHILKEIWRHVNKYWRECVIKTKSIQDPSPADWNVSTYLKSFPRYLRYCILVFQGGYFKELVFPKSNDLNINMMPFILSRNFEECHLPRLLLPYWKSIIQIIVERILFDEMIGRVCYLTINESRVEENQLQQMSGIHTERLGRLELHDGMIGDIDRGKGSASVYDSVYRKIDYLVNNGGIFIASTVADSCRVWDYQIMDDNCIGHLGDIEHLRHLLPESKVMEPNCLYMLTDRTPHEYLPLKKRQYRKYIKLVTSQVPYWFEEHSTKNPFGVVPDPSITKIVKGSIFNKGEAYIA